MEEDYTIAYCGLDCGTCKEFLATQSNNIEELKQIAEKWSQVKEVNFTVTVDDVLCDGCRADKRKSFHCSEACKIRACCLKKNLESCIECAEFPCANENSVADHIPDIAKLVEK